MSEENPAPNWHSIEEPELWDRLDTVEDGLKSEEAARRLEETGENTFEGDEGTHPLALLLSQFHSPIIYLLCGAVVLSLVAGKTLDAVAIAGVILLNTLLGFIEEWRAEGALAALREMSAPVARVRRGGQTQKIRAAEVVPGDVLVLETGDRAPADARVVSADELKADESALTGESEPVAKTTGRRDEDTAIADRDNMVWMSTSITGGRGLAVVVETGMRTEMGRIARDVRGTEREQTPLQKRMSRLGVRLGMLGVALGGLVFLLGLLRGYEVIEMLLFSVAAAVSSIPAGLPAVISVTLALGVRRMADRHAIIRRLPAVETLGSTTVICSDKTGTLTRNQMTVERLWADGREYQVRGEGYAPEGEILDEDEQAVGDPPDGLLLLLRIGALCNNAELVKAEERWRVDGNPSEGALLVAARKGGLDLEHLSDERPRRDEIPFSSEAKYMATLNDTPDDGRQLCVKGAPERVLGFCSHTLKDGERVELDDRLREEATDKAESLAGEAYRVMAGAYKDAGDANEVVHDEAEQGLTFVGLWGMMDPPRDESAQAVAETLQAGIKPVMITGDHATTALAIARMVGISESEKALSASDVEEMDNATLAEQSLESGVFARVAPEHKHKIMGALKEAGQIVAMTGDGVNDAPALKGADIGIAMGQSGTEVAREAADMVLTDDNFATIIHAIEEGRTIFANLQRVVFFLLATSLGEILTLVSALLVGLSLPLTTVMILWVNLVTDGVCTIPIGVEPRHRDVLKRKPRAPKAPILDRQTLSRMATLTPLMAIGTLGLFAWAQHYHADRGLAHSQTVAFATLAAFQWFQGFNARSHHSSVFSIGLFTNRALLIGIAVAVVLQFIAVQTPVGHFLFGTTPLDWQTWVLVVLVSSSIWVVDETRKALGLFGRAEEGQ